MAFVASKVRRRSSTALLSDRIDLSYRVVVAAQEDGPGIGRIRLCQIVDASAQSLVTRAGLGGTKERHPHRRVARLAAFGEERPRA